MIQDPNAVGTDELFYPIQKGFRYHYSSIVGNDEDGVTQW